MSGRDAIPIVELPAALSKTIQERDQVIAAKKSGIEGPYVFEDTQWKKPSLMR